MQDQHTFQVALTVVAVFAAVITGLEVLVRRLPPPDEERLREHRVAARKGILGVVASGVLLLFALRSQSALLGVLALAGLLTSTIVTLVRDRLSQKEPVANPQQPRVPEHPWLPTQRGAQSHSDSQSQSQSQSQPYGRRATDHPLPR
jgi:hypothetical protein